MIFNSQVLYPLYQNSFKEQKVALMRNMKKTILLSVLLFAIHIQAQTGKDTVALQNINTLKKDTVIIIKQVATDSVNRAYQEILEKTNSQLSLWWNPYGLFVAILGVLFGVLAIIASVVIYRQSKEHKELLKKSLEEHKIALDKLIEQKNDTLKNYDIILDNSINEYKAQLNDAINAETQSKIKEFIAQLEEQKKYFDIEIHTYKHSGWPFRDIQDVYPVNEETVFDVKIILNHIGQTFVIYIRVVTSDNKKYWLGFSGNRKNESDKTKNEYTLHQVYASQEINFTINVFSLFKQGFPEVSTLPVRIDCVRLRGSTSNSEEVLFSYKISNTI
jgi:predicted membrane protein